MQLAPELWKTRGAQRAWPTLGYLQLMSVLINGNPVCLFISLGLLLVQEKQEPQKYFR